MAVQQEPIRRFGVAEAIVLGGIFLASDGARFMPDPEMTSTAA